MWGVGAADGFAKGRKGSGKEGGGKRNLEANVPACEQEQQAPVSPMVFPSSLLMPLQPPLSPTPFSVSHIHTQ